MKLGPLILIISNYPPKLALIVIKVLEVTHRNRDVFFAYAARLFVIQVLRLNWGLNLIGGVEDSYHAHAGHQRFVTDPFKICDNSRAFCERSAVPLTWRQFLFGGQGHLS